MWVRQAHAGQCREPQKRRMKSDKQRQVATGRKGSNKTKLVLLGVAGRKNETCRDHQYRTTEARSFVSWLLPFA